MMRKKLVTPSNLCMPFTLHHFHVKPPRAASICPRYKITEKRGEDYPDPYTRKSGLLRVLRNTLDGMNCIAISPELAI